MTQVYQETPEPGKKDVIYLHESTTSGREESGPLEMTKVAAAMDIPIWIEANDDFHVIERELDGSYTDAITVTDTAQNDYSSGNYYTAYAGLGELVPMVVHLPANATPIGNSEQENQRVFTIKFATSDCDQALVDMRHCRATLKITQKGNIWVDGDARIDACFFDDEMAPGDESMLLEAHSYAWANSASDTSLKLYLDIERRRYDMAHTQPEGDIRVNDYLSGTGIDSARLEISFTDNGSAVNWISLERNYTASTDYPYAINVMANTGYTDNGTQRSCDATITYHAGGNVGLLTKTIHITQKYQKMEDSTLGLNLYAYGVGTGTGITVTPDSNRQIMFSLVKDSPELPVNYMFNINDSDLDDYLDFNSMSGIDESTFRDDRTMPNNVNTEDFIWKVAATRHEPFVIEVYAWKTTDSHVNVHLKLTVNAS